MSELLLQGATMTNEHCDRCGAPVFRYDGESFCPQCQHEAEQAQKQAQTQRQTGNEQADASPEQSANERPADGRPAAGTEPTQPPTAGRTGDRRTPPSKSDGRHASETRDRQRSRDTVDEQTRQPLTDLPEKPQGAAPSGEAANALESSIAALARRAAAADDPRTAREYLEAAREAAEALATLR